MGADQERAGSVPQSGQGAHGGESLAAGSQSVEELSDGRKMNQFLK